MNDSNCEPVLREVAEKHITKKQAIKREFEISEETKKLIEERDELKSQSRGTDVKGKLTRTSIRDDRTKALIQNLEECLWHDIKRAKTGFVPNHVKLKKPSGATSEERPEVLADYFEQKQWEIEENREKRVRRTKISKMLHR